MNKIFENKKELKTIKQFTEAAGTPYSSSYPYEMDRVTGDMCDCNGEGVFDLLPLDDPAVIEGGKRYMECRKCGRYSHL